jgi:lipopolysaccharide/colanic/teichoic acid biosynthesis glycosyltransferase
VTLETAYNLQWLDEPSDTASLGSEVSGVRVDPYRLTADGTLSDTLAQGLDFCAETLQVDGKRRFDIVVSLLLLVLTGPLLLLAMLAIWLGGLGRKPVLYRQIRVGLNGSRFSLLKLRTMRIDAEREGPRMAARNDARVTRIGKLLRHSRIDELPQLINVLRGEMSLIGPRPERPEFAALYEREIEGYVLRHSVKPGITGLAQVSQGYAENLPGAVIKLYHDLDYIRHCSLRTDLAIMLRTLPVVLTGWGAH